MKKWLRNLGLVLISLGVISIGVGGVFLLKNLFHAGGNGGYEAPAESGAAEGEKVAASLDGGQDGASQKDASGSAAREEGGKITATRPPVSITDKNVLHMLGCMTLEEKIGQMFLVDFSQLGGAAGTEVNERMRDILQEYKVGGVVFQQQNIMGKDQVVKLTKDIQKYSKYPAFLALQEELGKYSVLARVSSLGAQETPNIGRLTDEKSCQDAGNVLGGNLAALGLNMELGHVADVYIEGASNSYLLGRTFGNDSATVGAYTGAMVKGIQTNPVSAVVRYFPGMGGAPATEEDQYADSPRTLAQLRDTELAPYREAVKADVDAVMVSNMKLVNADDSGLPCSMSPAVIDGLLRGELGYNGLVITAPLNDPAISGRYGTSEAVLGAIEAGADMLCMPSNLDAAFRAVKSAVQSGQITQARIDESAARILLVKIKRRWLDPGDYKTLVTASPAPTSTPEPEDPGQEEDGGWEDEERDSDREDESDYEHGEEE